MSSSTELVVRDLNKTYANGRRALMGINLQVGPGLYGLLGPNGAGKSTLMRTLATLQTPDAGSIHFAGVDVLAQPDALRRQLGYLPQQLGAYPGASGRALIERFAWLKGYTDRRSQRDEAVRLLERVNLSEASEQEVTTYSGGMLRRLGIAIALIGAPRFLVVDEPTAGLDPAERNRFHRVLADVASDAVVLLSTHIVDDIENLCSRLSILRAGTILAEGTPAELTAPLAGRLWVAEYERGRQPPEGALNLMATPRGLRASLVADASPGANFTAQTPRLDDAYHYLLAQSDGASA